MDLGFAWRHGGGSGRVLKAGSNRSERSSGTSGQNPDHHPDVCRICWSEGTSDEGGKLVTPCECSGTMKHVHLTCLGHWQQQLRVQKGMFASRRCDICKATWREPYRDVAGAYGTPRTWRSTAFTTIQALQPLMFALLDSWKAITLARGIMQGLETGAAGFRLGMHHHALAGALPRGQFANLVRWAPCSIWMAGVMPAVQFPAFLAMYATASTVAIVQGSFIAVAGMYAGWVSGFAQGVTHTVLESVHRVLGTSGAVVRAVAALLHRVMAVVR